MTNDEIRRVLALAVPAEERPIESVKRPSPQRLADARAQMRKRRAAKAMV